LFVEKGEFENGGEALEVGKGVGGQKIPYPKEKPSTYGKG